MTTATTTNTTTTTTTTTNNTTNTTTTTRSAVWDEVSHLGDEVTFGTSTSLGSSLDFLTFGELEFNY